MWRCFPGNDATAGWGCKLGCFNVYKEQEVVDIGERNEPEKEMGLEGRGIPEKNW